MPHFTRKTTQSLARDIVSEHVDRVAVCAQIVAGNPRLPNHLNRWVWKSISHSLVPAAMVKAMMKAKLGPKTILGRILKVGPSTN